jgi:hypothetical protein
MISLPCGKSESHFTHLSSKWTQGSHLVLGGFNESNFFKIMKLNIQFFSWRVFMYACTLIVYWRCISIILHEPPWKKNFFHYMCYWRLHYKYRNTTRSSNITFKAWIKVLSEQNKTYKHILNEILWIVTCQDVEHILVNRRTELYPISAPFTKRRLLIRLTYPFHTPEDVTRQFP